MTREELLALKIKPINKKIEKEVKAIWDGIAKPLDGLGEFELLLARIGGILESTDLNLQKKAIIAMCADNGIVAEHVSQSGQEVTAMHFFYGKAAEFCWKDGGTCGRRCHPGGYWNQQCGKDSRRA